MKHIPAILLLALSCYSQTSTTESKVTLVWKPSPSKQVEGYRLAWGERRGGPWKNEVDCKAETNGTLTLPKGRPVYIVVYAYAGDETSKPSNEVGLWDKTAAVKKTQVRRLNIGP